ncbi:MAG: hypothetical protein Fur0037_25580 [Planctomycetota bacterium]
MNRVGPDAADIRQGAVENLLQRLDLPAHAILQEKIVLKDDPDRLRHYILSSIARKLAPNSQDRVFGAVDENREACCAIVRSYVRPLSCYWREDSAVPEDLRSLARTCVVRMPARELEAGLRAMLDSSIPLEDRIAALRVAADCQNLYLARLLADFLDVPEDPLRTAAREGLRLLTFSEEGMTTRKEVEEWLERNHGRRYLDLAEEAARHARDGLAEWRRDLEARLRKTRVDLVVALIQRPAETDWARVQAEVLTDDPAGTTDACLERLVQLPGFQGAGENPSAARLAFAKALFEKLEAGETNPPRRQALLLEALAVLVRPEEPDLGSRTGKHLLSALSSPFPELRLAGIRGLRRFSSPESRVALVGLAKGILGGDAEIDAGSLEALREILRTIGKKPYVAPGNGDKDLEDWLEVILIVLSRKGLEDLRNDALSMAQLADSEGKLLPRVFSILLDLGRNGVFPADLRVLCLIRLKDFAQVPERADRTVAELVRLLDDADASVRRFAATELGKLPDASEAKKHAWLTSVLESVRRRMLVEGDASVFEALTITASACAAAPGSPANVIPALISVVDALGDPVPAEKQFQVEPLLRELAVLAVTPTLDAPIWIEAGRRLLRHGKRKAVRGILEQQHAIDIAADLEQKDPKRARAARSALRLILDTALQKPPEAPWGDLKQEVADVRGAFEALSAVKEPLDDPDLCILRLEILDASGSMVPNAWTQATQLADQWLGANGGSEAAPKLDAAAKDRIRILAALVHLRFSDHSDAASRLLGAVDPIRLKDPLPMSLMDRLAKAYAESTREGDAPKELEWRERVLKLTGKDDKLYRVRLLAWARSAIGVHPDEKESVRARLLQDAALFAAADCPPDQRAQFESLSGTN